MHLRKTIVSEQSNCGLSLLKPAIILRATISKTNLFNSFWISLYIAEGKRRSGGASALLECLEHYGERLGVPGIFAVYRLTKETEEFYRLLKSRGYYEAEQKGEGFSFSLSDLNRNKIEKVAALILKPKT